VTRTEVDTEAEFDEQMRERLEELGYTGGGHVYEFLTAKADLDSILDDIEDATGLRFREGADGHASLAGDTLRITSKEEIANSKLEDIERLC